jgi:hypothetical protein
VIAGRGFVVAVGSTLGCEFPGQLIVAAEETKEHILERLFLCLPVGRSFSLLIGVAGGRREGVELIDVLLDRPTRELSN